jgi:hypothetical protein
MRLSYKEEENMVVIRRCCEVHLSQEEINHLKEAADIINRIWSVMLTESYAGKTERIDTETMGEHQIFFKT